MGHRDIRDEAVADDRTAPTGSWDQPFDADDGPTPWVLGGGIGAGKSSVLAELASLGFAIVQADKAGHAVLQATHPAGRAVMARWPEAVGTEGIDRSRLAGIVFGDPAELAHLEAITHPAIRETLTDWVEQARSSGSLGVVVEVPLLRVMARTPWRRIAVIAPEDVRLARAVARGGDRTDVLARMRNQEPDEAWAEWADVVIDNGGSWDETKRQIRALVEGPMS